MMTTAYSENDVFGDFPTKRQSSLLIESWSEIESQLDEVGIETFRKLFQAHSDIEAYFPSMKKLSSSDLEMARCVSAQFYQHHSKYSPISPVPGMQEGEGARWQNYGGAQAVYWPPARPGPGSSRGWVSGDQGPARGAANICTLQVRRTSSGGLKANLST